MLDEKEELVTERDVYKTKFDRLNQELNYILKGEENRIVDIDALVMDNKYVLQTSTRKPFSRKANRPFPSRCLGKIYVLGEGGGFPCEQV